MKYLLALWLTVLLSAAILSQTAPPPPGLTVDRIYDVIVLPLQKENYQLKLEKALLGDQITALQKEVADLKKPAASTQP